MVTKAKVGDVPAWVAVAVTIMCIFATVAGSAYVANNNISHLQKAVVTISEKSEKNKDDLVAHKIAPAAHVDSDMRLKNLESVVSELKEQNKEIQKTQQVIQETVIEINAKLPE